MTVSILTPLGLLLHTTSLLLPLHSAPVLSVLRQCVSVYSRGPGTCDLPASAPCHQSCLLSSLYNYDRLGQTLPSTSSSQFHLQGLYLQIECWVKMPTCGIAGPFRVQLCPEVKARPYCRTLRVFVFQPALRCAVHVSSKGQCPHVCVWIFAFV